MATSNPTSLSTRYIFGFNSLVTENISFADDDTIAYIAGIKYYI
jgi:hypothetical protein